MTGRASYGSARMAEPACRAWRIAWPRLAAAWSSAPSRAGHDRYWQTTSRTHADACPGSRRDQPQRSRARHDLNATLRTELAKDVVDVGLDRGQADHQG